MASLTPRSSHSDSDSDSCGCCCCGEGSASSPTTSSRPRPCQDGGSASPCPSHSCDVSVIAGAPSCTSSACHGGEEEMHANQSERPPRSSAAIAGQCVCPCHACIHTTGRTPRAAAPRGWRATIRVDATSHPPIAVARALLAGAVAPAHRGPRTRSTFGCGRAGMASPVKKTTLPGPGSYHPDQGQAPVSRATAAAVRGRARIQRPSGTAAPVVDQAALREACTCYWKRFPGVEMPAIPAAHATYCPLNTSPAGGAATQKSGASASRRRSRQRSTHRSTSSSSSSSVRSGASVSTLVAMGLEPPSARGDRLRRGGGAERSASQRLSQDRRRGATFGTAPRRTLFNVDGSQTERPLTKPPRHTSTQKGATTRTAGASSRADHGVPRGQLAGEHTADDVRRSGRAVSTADVKHGAFVATPGPGEYDLPSTFDAAAARRAMGSTLPRGARRLGGDASAKAGIPGPGSYAVEAHGTMTTATFSTKNAAGLMAFGSTSARQTFPLEAAKTPTTVAGGLSGTSPSPGPGEYHNTAAQGAVAKSTPSYSFPKAHAATVGGRAMHFAGGETDVPGPGAYDVDHRPVDASPRTAVVTTAVRRTDVWQHHNHPDAPGLSAAALPVDAMPTPGPGAYDIDRGLAAVEGPANRGVSMVFRSCSPTALIGSTGATGTDLTPGPGHYDVVPRATGGPQWSIGGRRDTGAPPEVSPGPGEYVIPSLDVDRPHSPSTVFGTAQRGLTVDTLPADAASAGASRPSAPGPGAYDVATDGDFGAASAGTDGVRLRGVPFGTAPRVTVLDDAVALSSGTPGPGAYHYDAAARAQLRGSPPTAMLGLTEARSLPFADGKDGRPSPGPGSYDAAVDATLPNTRSAVVGTAVLDTLFGGGGTTSGEDVGPGTYEIRGGIADDIRHAFTFTREPRAVTNAGEASAGSTATFAGPGSYDAHVAEDRLRGAVASAVFGTSERPAPFTDADVGTPGPGAYSPQAPATKPPVVIFGTSERFAPGDGSGCPGAEGVRGDASNGLHGASLLGPGAYDPQPVWPAVPGGRMTVAPRFGAEAPGHAEADEGGPGPGAYEIEPVVFRVDRGQFAVFGTAPTGRGDSPAPRGDGAGAVREESPDSPGPGTYSPLLAAALPRSPAAVFGTEGQRPAAVVAGTVLGEQLERPDIGPGTYDPVLQYPHAFAVHLDVAGRVGGDDRLGAVGATGDIGPGHYSPDRLHDAADRSAFFGTSPREPREWVDGSLPGPGTYTASTSVVHAKAPSAFIGTSAARVADSPSGSGGADGAEAPGPGHYALPAPPSAATFLIGTAPRAVDSRVATPRATEEMPGPGHYDPARAGSTGPAVVFGTSAKGAPLSPHAPANSTPADVPGPGYYAYRPVFPGGATFTISPPAGPSERLPAVMVVEESPGPGAYATSGGLGSGGPAHRFGTAYRELHQEARHAQGDPGPGAYNVENAARPTSPLRGGVAMHLTEARFKDARQDDFAGVAKPAVDTLGTQRSTMPGPGQYNPESPQWRPHPSYTIPLSEAAGGHHSAVPGPGAYSPQYVADTATTRAAVFGTDVRATVDAAGVGEPGPGHYDQVLVGGRFGQDGVAHRFGTSGRDGSGPRPGVSPGPGSYDVTPSRPTGPMISFGRPPVFVECAESARPEEVPGPGAYAVAPLFPSRARGPVMLLAERFPSSDARVEDPAVPGPGAYSPAAAAGRAPRTVTFGTAPRGEEAAVLRGGDAPGPGAYSMTAGGMDAAPSALLDLRAPRFPAAADQLTAHPGPAAYSPVDPAARIDAHAGRFSVAHRFEADARHDGAEVGPGSYAVPHALPGGRAVPFPTAPRFGALPGAAAGSSPGPGAYDAHLYDPARGPAFTLGQRPPSEPTAGGSDTPGPGAYNAALWASGSAPTSRAVTISPLPAIDPACAMAARARATPGPAAYSLPPPTGGRWQGPSFATAPRSSPTDAAAATPGPGEYAVEAAARSSPAFSFQRAASSTRPPEEASTAAGPGPGAYAHLDAYLRTAARAAPAYSIPMAAAPPVRIAGPAPGPGAYDVAAGTVAASRGRDAPPAGFSFGTAPAGGRERIYTDLGPGEYYRPIIWGDGGVTMAGRGRPLAGHSQADIPGPGAYDHLRSSPGGATMDWGAASLLPSAVAVSFHGPSAAPTGAPPRVTAVPIVTVTAAASA